MVPKIIKMSLKDNPISKEKESHLFNKGFLTGSRVFGGADKNSDYDLLFENERDWDVLDLFMDTAKLAYIPNDYRTDEFTSWYFKTQDEKYINIISFFDKENYFIWCKATELMLNLINTNDFIKSGVKDKKLRVQLFEILKEYIWYNRK